MKWALDSGAVTSVSVSSTTKFGSTHVADVFRDPRDADERVYGEVFSTPTDVDIGGVRCEIRSSVRLRALLRRPELFSAEGVATTGATERKRSGTMARGRRAARENFANTVSTRLSKRPVGTARGRDLFDEPGPRREPAIDRNRNRPWLVAMEMVSAESPGRDGDILLRPITLSD